MKKATHLIIITLVINVLSSCSGYNKLLKSTDYDAKFEAAMQYYNEGRYQRARDLFENLTLYYRGREHSEDIWQKSH